jgi:hypothetical protein
MKNVSSSLLKINLEKKVEMGAIRNGGAISSLWLPDARMAKGTIARWLLKEIKSVS